MTGNGFTPNNNRQVIRMLSKEFGRFNKGRNRILMGAIVLCIITLTMVFGISFGKVQAEYMKAVRAAGTTASACIEDADESQYEKVCSLSYVKQVGRCVSVGTAAFEEQPVCKIQVLDDVAWEKMMQPAYTDIYGQYPKEKQEIMLSVIALKSMGIDDPEKGMKVRLTVTIGLFRTEQEEFCLSGWYSDYVDDTSGSAIGYISEAKLKDWGYSIQEKADLLICQSDNMDWRETEERLYQDVAGKTSELKITVSNTYTYDAVNRLTGSYGMAALGALVILSGMFFLVYNVMQISMTEDIRQMGLLNTIGTTRKQIRKIYFGQIRRIMIPGVLVGAFASVFILVIVIPKILGNQYLSGFGGAKEFRVFRSEFLVAAVVFTITLTMGAAAGVIHHLVNLSCMGSIHYTGLIKNRTSRKKKWGGFGKEQTLIRCKKRNRTVNGELWYMAWQNVTRYRIRFLLTIFSLFLGMEACLGVVVISRGSDYVHVIEKRPDFLIAGEFSDWGQEEGYGNEYKSRDLGEDPMETEGDNFCLLYGNAYDEFSPISSDVREQLLSLEGVDEEKSYVMEGAYMISTISQKGIRPLVSNYFNVEEQVKEGVGYSYDYSMVEGVDADVIQILSEEEITSLSQYVQDNHLSIDMEDLKNGTGVMILHDHQLSPKQEELAKESIGEPIFFTKMLSKEAWILWNQLSSEEWDAMETTEMFSEIQSETYTLCGYLDNRAEGFPNIRQTWHGSEGLIYYLISEKGFAKLPTEKKTLYMELNVDQKREPQIKTEIQNILSQENRKREEMTGNKVDGETGEAGIFCISKSDLLAEAANYIRGNRLILGSISVVLLFAGVANYFNVMVTEIISRKKELEILESIGMTKRQKRKLLTVEGLYYCLAVVALMLTVGNGILYLIRFYMEDKLSYFVFTYPVGWLIVGIGCLIGICAMIPKMLYIKRDLKTPRPQCIMNSER